MSLAPAAVHGHAEMCAVRTVRRLFAHKLQAEGDDCRNTLFDQGSDHVSWRYVMRG